jgi:hypothetical protein
MDESWELLASASQHHNIKVSALAEHVIATGTLADPPGPGDGSMQTSRALT